MVDEQVPCHPKEVLTVLLTQAELKPLFGDYNRMPSMLAKLGTH